MPSEMPEAVTYKPRKVNMLYETLYDLLDTWEESAKVGNHEQIESAIVDHARCLLAMPDASLGEMLDFLRDQ